MAGPSPTPSPTSSPTPTPSPSSTTSASDFAEKARAARFLLRAQFSALPAEIEAVRKEGAEAWLARHMRQSNDQTAEQFFRQHGYDQLDQKREHLFDRLTDPMIWSQLLSGGNAVRKRVAFALSQFFVVSANRLDIVWPAQAIGAYWDLLSKHAFGNFRDLLEDISLSPAMGAFLDSIGNLREDFRIGRLPDENYAREIMQLFTIGLHELHVDGSLKTYADEPIETYTNEDVAGLAKVFTGYNLDTSGLQFSPDPGSKANLVPHPDAVRRPMTADPTRWARPSSQSEHSLSEKSFLGISIPQGTGATESLRIALDVLFSHPNVGPFFGKQMIQRLVTSNPSPAYIHRVAEAFNNNGRGIRGDLAAVFKAILLDPEADSAYGLNDFRFGKLREPVVRFVQFARSFGMNKSERDWITRDLSDPSSFLGQAPLRSPSVFNFFRPHYVLPGSVTAANALIGPEFQIVNESTVAGYMNFMERTILGQYSWASDLRPTYQVEIELAHDATALLEHLDLILTAGQLRDATREAIKTAIEDLNVDTNSDEATKLKRVHISVMLIMSSHDYLVQK